MHRDFFRIISQKPEYVKSVFNDSLISFHFTYLRLIFYNQSN